VPPHYLRTYASHIDSHAGQRRKLTMLGNGDKLTMLGNGEWDLYFFCGKLAMLGNGEN
jgi:hypothetical protein